MIESAQWVQRLGEIQCDSLKNKSNEKVGYFPSQNDTEGLNMPKDQLHCWIYLPSTFLHKELGFLLCGASNMSFEKDADNGTDSYQ